MLLLSVNAGSIRPYGLARQVEETLPYIITYRARLHAGDYSITLKEDRPRPGSVTLSVGHSLNGRIIIDRGPLVASMVTGAPVDEIHDFDASLRAQIGKELKDEEPKRDIALDTTAARLHWLRQSLQTLLRLFADGKPALKAVAQLIIPRGVGCGVNERWYTTWWPIYRTFLLNLQEIRPDMELILLERGGSGGQPYDKELFGVSHIDERMEEENGGDSKEEDEDTGPPPKKPMKKKTVRLTPPPTSLVKKQLIPPIPAKSQKKKKEEGVGEEEEDFTMFMNSQDW